jgi:hypothetical protein
MTFSAVPTAAEVQSTGLTAAQQKAAQTSVAGCEFACCHALSISGVGDPPIAGRCGIWQWHKEQGCWLALDQTLHKLPSRETPDDQWIGASGNLGEPAKWGWPLIIVLLCCSLVYVVGGVGYNVKMKQLPPIDAFPQLTQWKQLGGLVADGCAFSFAQARTAVNRAMGNASSADSTEPLIVSGASEPTVVDVPKAAAPKPKADSESDSGSDVAE